MFFFPSPFLLYVSHNNFFFLTMHFSSMFSLSFFFTSLPFYTFLFHLTPLLLSSYTSFPSILFIFFTLDIFHFPFLYLFLLSFFTYRVLSLSYLFSESTHLPFHCIPFLYTCEHLLSTCLTFSSFTYYIHSCFYYSFTSRHPLLFLPFHLAHPLSFLASLSPFPYTFPSPPFPLPPRPLPYTFPIPLPLPPSLDTLCRRHVEKGGVKTLQLYSPSFQH